MDTQVRDDPIERWEREHQHRLALARMEIIDRYRHLAVAFKDKREAIASLPMAERIDKIIEASGWANSEMRLEVLLGHLFTQPSDVFWPVLVSEWSACDATTMWQWILLDWMRRHRLGCPGLPTSEKRIRIWRGCSR